MTEKLTNQELATRETVAPNGSKIPDSETAMDILENELGCNLIEYSVDILEVYMQEID